MPLIKSSSDDAFKSNVKTLMGEVGKSPHVQSREQALAIAYATKRRGKAFGGGLGGGMTKAPSSNPSWQTRTAAREMLHSGPIMSMVPGRTDKHPMKVAGGSYVFTADHVSHLGQNNTVAGFNKLNKMFKMGPYDSGAAMPIKHGPGAPRAPKLAGVADVGGGRGIHGGAPVEIITAGGEFVVPPHKILEWQHRNGFPPNLDEGHAALDKWQTSTRKEHRATLAKLPGPAKS